MAHANILLEIGQICGLAFECLNTSQGFGLAFHDGYEMMADVFVFMPIGSNPALFRWFVQVGNNNYSLELECDCAVSFVFQVVIEGVKKGG